MLYNFFVSHLQIFVISWVFVPGKPFQPSLMFASKVGAYPSETPTLGSAPSLIHKH